MPWVLAAISVSLGGRGAFRQAADAIANGTIAPAGLTPVSDVRNGPQDRREAAWAGACHNFDMQDASHLPGLVTGLAFVLAAVFGAVATRVNFCTMGAISDVVNFGDTRRLRMWLLAIAVAMAGAAGGCIPLHHPAACECGHPRSPEYGRRSA